MSRSDAGLQTGYASEQFLQTIALSFWERAYMHRLKLLRVDGATQGGPHDSPHSGRNETKTKGSNRHRIAVDQM